MQQLVTRKFWDVYSDESLNILEIHWKKQEDQSELDEEDFKLYLYELAELTENEIITGFLVDARPYHVVMTVEFQEWHDQVIIPQYIKNGIKNIVFVLNEEALIEAASIEQTFEEQQAAAIKTHFVNNLQFARDIFRLNG